MSERNSPIYSNRLDSEGSNDWRLCRHPGGPGAGGEDRYEMLSQPGETKTCLPGGEIQPEMSGGKAGDNDPILAVYGGLPHHIKLDVKI